MASCEEMIVVQILALTLSDGSVSIVDAPTPTLAPGQVRVRTLHSAVSPGTEGNKIRTGKQSLLQKARSRPDQVKQVLDMVGQVGLKGTIQKVRAKLDGAQPLGYSLSGRVIEVAPDVQHLRPGQLVACAGGGYANHADEVVVPVNLVARVPEGVPADAAAMTTLGAIALQGVRLAQPTLGEHAVVVGLGLVGLLAGQLLRASGCRVIGTDIAPAAVDLARRSGSVDLAVSDGLEAAVAEFTRGQGADLVLICAATSSNEPVSEAARICRKRGRVVVVGAVGMDLPRDDYYAKEIQFSVSCSYGPGRYDPDYEEHGRDYPLGFVRWTEGRNLEAVLDMMAAGACRPLDLVTHRFAFADAERAYALFAAGGEPYAGILLDYPATEPARLAAVACGDRARGGGDLGVGFIGCGSYAQSFLLPPFRQAGGVALTAIHTRTGLSAADVGRRAGFRRAVDEAQAVLDDPDTAAVVIATRHDQHGPLALAALAAGKHVFVEKPLCLDRAELAAIARWLAAHRQAAPILQVGFNRRFSRAARAVKAHLGDSPGPLTMVYRVNAGPLPREHWTQDPAVGGGRIVGEVCHFIDLMQYCCGADPTEVHAVCVAGGREALAEDNVILTLRFEDGSVGTILYSARGGKAMPKEELQVLGGGRSAVLDNFGEVRLYAGGRRRRRMAGKGQDEEVAAFLQAVRSGEPAIPAAGQLATTLATFAALESLRSGRPQPVDVAALLDDA
ncbi:MAG: bi-domain-containing oxidoreductase [Candidatus Krumholzibacteriia bacterium]